MDHLAIPNQSLHSPVDVPYLCTEDYDGGEWVTYPHRNGIDDIQLEQPGCWNGKLGILQNWLYFGLLKAFFGQALQTTEFLKKCRNGQRRVNTLRLPYWLQRWEGMFYQQPPQIQNRLEAQVDFQLDTWFSAFNSVLLDDEVGRVILFSIAVLHEAFCNTWANIHRSKSLKRIQFRNYLAKSDILSFPWSRMISDGWCKHEVELLRVLPPSTSYYMSLADRPGPDINHTACTKAKCNAYGAPTTKHLDGGCNCELIYADRRLMSSILLNGSFPLIRMEKGEVGQPPTLKIIAHQPYIRFVALSHVWTDGLGNPQGNSLPTCQLEKLTKLADQVYSTNGFRTSSLGEGVNEVKDDLDQILHEEFSWSQGDYTKVYLWVDTICCPTASESPEAHALSLAAMPKTYSEATKVLVLDSYIQAFPPRNRSVFQFSKFPTVSSLERVIRIRSSRWTQRVWTLQEGALAKELWFKFADRMMDFETLFFDLFERLFGHRGDVPEDIYEFYTHIRCIKIPEYFTDVFATHHHIDSTNLLDHLRRHALMKDPRTQALEFQEILRAAAAESAAADSAMTLDQAYIKQLVKVCDSISTRSLSNPSDEAICLAILLDLDINSISQLPAEQRMRKFWEMQPILSRSIVLFSGEKLHTPGLRWAPASLLSQPTMRDFVSGRTALSDAPAKLTPLGLETTFVGGISKNTVYRNICNRFFFREESTGFVFLVGPLDDSKEDYVWPSGCTRPSKVAIIILDDMCLAGLGPEVSSFTRGILAFVEAEREDGVINVQLGQQVVIQYAAPGTGWQSPWQGLIDEAEKRKDGIVGDKQVFMDGKWVDGSQKWCIM